MFELIGKTIGPYRILEQIGVGGMAIVYKAYHPNMDRYVALKVLPHHLSQDPEFAKRFQREARAIARLEHSNILPVHDYGEYEGVTYIVMRYMEAGSLKDRMAAGALSPDEVHRLINQIGGALDYGHRMGVIHRDVKPGNVLIDGQGNAYLSDFGLARMMESSQKLTASGVGLGTPAYMSPEQGRGIKVDHRTDIYSLGIILYELLIGRVPYEAETPMAVVLKHINDELPLPRAIKPDLPESFERIILKALAKDPADRYQTAGEMVQSLAEAIRQAGKGTMEQHRLSPTKPAPVREDEDISVVSRIQKVWAQPRGKVGLASGVVVVLVAFGLLLSRLPGQVAIVGPGSGITVTPSITHQLSVASPTNTGSVVIPQSSAVTPVPTTESLSSETEQNRTFAEPILAAIAGREPDYEDDFSNLLSGWEIRQKSESCCYGWVGYQNDEYVVFAEPLKPYQIQVSEGWNWAWGNNEQIAPSLTDYIVEIDQYWVSGNGLTSLYLCDSRWECYSIRLWSPGNIIDFGGESPTKPRIEFANDLLVPWVTKLDQPISLMVIKNSLEVAVYTNGTPAYYILLPEEYQRKLDFIQLRVGTNSMDLAVEVHWDNLRIWDISDLER